MSTPGSTVVIGLGCECRGDDAAGLEVVRLLARDSLPPSVVVLENYGDAAELIESWTGACLAIVVDAAMSGAPPGTLHRHSALGLAPTWQGSSHVLSLADAIDLARALGRLPRRLLLLGIEGEDFAVGGPMSPSVRAAVARTAEMLRGRFGGGADQPPMR
ncbi:hydrogenase maturation protease [Sphaerisporangium sp. B11E5]|uniref:hydrogenase maturation protease n=1 Tax=Sphaerisporangium sp. B11E5 TaxID=3153563 RepID=UPI00325F6759